MSTGRDIITIVLVAIGLACDGDTETAKKEDPQSKGAIAKPAAKAEVVKTDLEKPEPPAPEKPQLPTPPPEPEITVCGGQQQQAITSMKALTACVTEAVEASGVPDASATMAKLAADTHACTDKGCSEKLAEAMTSYGTEMAGKRETQAGKGSCEKQVEAVQDANAKVLECTAAAMGGNEIDAAIARMSTYADEMCACKDKACADAVMAAMIKYGETMQKQQEGKPERKVSDAQKLSMEGPMKRITECMTKTMAG